MIPEELEQANLPAWTRYGILEGYRGSHGHGTYIPSTEPNSVDDIDIFRVVVQPEEHYLGLGSYLKTQEHYETFIGQYDVLVYDIRKFMHLLSKGNPNVHIFLWLRPEDYFKITGAGEYLLSHRTEFLSQKVIQSFGGYAVSQLRRMTHFEYKGYMGDKRKALVNQYGYDCKNAAHCIRLLATALDLLKTGNLVVYREKDGETLIEIKTGRWTLERVKEYANKLKMEFESLAPLSTLPLSVNQKMLEDVLLKVMKLAWKEA
ncbi:MAG: nucleotidyltransferase domain-containing protein [Nitrospirae bacterium]|nr:nucleotidyltransferase domain-containing protein [Nitrospirota bacterium]